MKSRILSAFPNCIEEKCFHIESSGTFKIFDREDKCCFICKEEEPDSLSFVTIKNESCKDLHFLAIDKCVLPGSEQKKCDCAIFDDATFCFIEIKVISSHKKKSIRKTEAYEQLKLTIQHFKKKVSFHGFTVDAYICLGRSITIPKCSSTKMARTKELFDLCGANLFEGNVVQFQ